MKKQKKGECECGNCSWTVGAETQTMTSNAGTAFQYGLEHDRQFVILHARSDDHAPKELKEMVEKATAGLPVEIRIIATGLKTEITRIM